MFDSTSLATHLSTNSTISGEVLVLAEWNLNDPEKIERISNYCNPPDEELTDIFDYTKEDDYYCNNADVTIAGPLDDNGDPKIFNPDKLKQKLLYSLDDCTKPHRPRSGINHATYRPGSFIAGPTDVNRPRYYMGSYHNVFKYWTSAQTREGSETGVSQYSQDTGRYEIYDVAPFVAYKEDLPANKIVIKMQTNIGSVDYGQMRTDSYFSTTGEIDDPFYGESNATTPRTWRIQALYGTTWTTVKTFNENDRRSDDTPIVGPDGYVELFYGLRVPEQHIGQSRYVGTVISASHLPSTANEGDIYIVVTSDGEKGSGYIRQSGSWEGFIVEYGWNLREDYDVDEDALTSFTSPPSFAEGGDTKYRQFEYIKGIRIVVDTMNKEDCSFDLIEMSPRLVANITDSVEGYSVNKSIGSIDTTKLPVGQLEAGTGSIEIFDYTEAFRSSNSNSIIRNLLDSNIAFTFYEIVRGVDGEDIHVPIKKLYTENKSPNYKDYANISYELRDLYYLLERTDAPSLMLTNVSLSVAVSTLLDYVGFSNYTFRRIADVPEPIIPYFFVAPDQNVAEVLQKLSIATQSAMFFDEYNDFVVMYREYMMPESDDYRSPDITVRGDDTDNTVFPDIVEIASDEKHILNKGTVKFNERYIQRTTGSLAQQSFVNEDQFWIYKPALLWEAAGTESTRTINDAVADQSSYALSAVPLSSDLSATAPYVANGEVVNNVIDLGEGVYWLARAQGYLYSSGEIIKYDAVQYAVQGVGDVWVTDNADYQKYMASLPFNGKMYPTGLVRIFTEPYVREDTGTYQNGRVKKHGRGQFQTDVQAHTAGLDSYWVDNANANCVSTSSEYLFQEGLTYPTVFSDGAIQDKTSANLSYRGGIIKNHMRNVFYTESELGSFRTPRSGTVRSSAFILQGKPNISDGSSPRDYITYVSKTLNSAIFRHVGARMRIIGQQSALADSDLQSPSGANDYYSNINGSVPVVQGGSGGIAMDIVSNDFTGKGGTGYFFEIIALTNTNLEDTLNDGAVVPHNVVFYKMLSDANGKAVPVKLWGGSTTVLVDSGDFVGEGRLATEENPTVYDLNIESKKVGSTKRFYLYINNTQVATVDDHDPLSDTFEVSMFVRGNSKCMFENMYAISKNIAANKSTEVVAEGLLSDAFGANNVTSGELRKYSLSGMVANSYLSGVNPTGDDEFKIWYEEFGSIMRECAYFDIRYDKAYPAIYAQISPVFNASPGYAVSGFSAGAYGAKFLIFNIMDKAISLDDDSGNYLRIQGVTFTQNVAREYSLDDYYEDAGNISGTAIDFNNSTLTTTDIQDRYRDIKIKRMKYGVSEFSVESDYIQTQDSAARLMEWLADKTTRPRQLVGINLFFNPMIQLGDIVSIQYASDDSDLVAGSDKRFVVYKIDQQRSSDGPSTTLYLSES